MKTFVVAGNIQQANDWVKKDLEKRKNNGVTTLSWSDYCIVTDAKRIRGIDNPHGVFIGTWRERPDLRDIISILMVSTRGQNQAINGIWLELNGIL